MTEGLVDIDAEGLATRVITRLRDEGFRLSARDMSRFLDDVGRPRTKDSRLPLREPPYVKRLEGGLKRVARFDWGEGAGVAPDGFVHFETWRGLTLVDQSDIRIAEYVGNAERAPQRGLMAFVSRLAGRSFAGKDLR